MQEDFDGSALRELLTPAVTGRGRTSAPTDAIVTAGRRRVVGRRSAVAGGALVIVAAVPLAATAIAAGPDKAATTSAAGAAGSGAGSVAKGTTPGALTPPRTDAKTESAPQTKPATSTPQAKNPPSSLPTHPTLLASGTVEGLPWKVTAVTTGGNNALTAGQKCLGLDITVNGHGSWINTEPTGVYCLPIQDPDQYLWSYQDTLQYDYRGGKGTLQMGLVSADVTKVVAHVDGLAPITENTVPAPAFDTQSFYFVPVPRDDEGFHITIDEYNAQGVKVGTYDNSVPNPTH